MSVIGTEDCLNLAVFTPAVTKPGPSKLLPVMVFIHGGGFTRGSYTALGSNYLLDEDVVLVNLHYRLSGLGFLCLNTAQSRSNVGLLDQLMALRWVQRNIRDEERCFINMNKSQEESPLTKTRLLMKYFQRFSRYFGGDPGQVVLVGESAGAASVSYLMSSPAGRGLFSKAVLMSGANTAQWALNSRPREYSSGLARALGCPLSDQEEMVRCVKYRRSVEQIVQAGEKYRSVLRVETRVRRYTVSLLLQEGAAGQGTPPGYRDVRSLSGLHLLSRHTSLTARQPRPRSGLRRQERGNTVRSPGCGGVL